MFFLAIWDKHKDKNKSGTEEGRNIRTQAKVGQREGTVFSYIIYNMENGQNVMPRNKMIAKDWCFDILSAYQNLTNCVSHQPSKKSKPNTQFDTPPPPLLCPNQIWTVQQKRRSDPPPPSCPNPILHATYPLTSPHVQTKPPPLGDGQKDDPIP